MLLITKNLDNEAFFHFYSKSAFLKLTQTMLNCFSASKSVKKVEMAIFTCQFCEESFKLRNVFYKHIREQVIFVDHGL